MEAKAIPVISLTLAVCLLAWQQNALAQGAVQPHRQCPRPESVDADSGTLGGAKPFNYESWEKTDHGARVFIRCIGNPNKGHGQDVWTHWRHILAKGWTPPKGRTYAETRYSGQVGKVQHYTTLMYGDDKNSRAHPETICARTEKACTEDNALSPIENPFRYVRLVIPETPEVQHFTVSVASLLGDARKLEIINRNDFWIPFDPQHPEAGLARLQVIAESMYGDAGSPGADIEGSAGTLRSDIHVRFLNSFYSRQDKPFSVLIHEWQERGPLQFQFKISSNSGTGAGESRVEQPIWAFSKYDKIGGLPIYKTRTTESVDQFKARARLSVVELEIRNAKTGTTLSTVPITLIHQ